jgi:hypothetical protein
MKLLSGKLLASFVIAISATPLLASDIGTLRQKPVEFTYTSSKSMFDIERCAVEVDNMSVPFVYRQPDRPNEAMIAWSGGIGVPFLLNMHADEGLVTIELRRSAILIRKPPIPKGLTDCF